MPHFRKHHLLLGLLALVVAASLLYSYTTLRVSSIAPEQPPVLVPPTQPPVTNTPVTKGDCRPSGCSGQICSDQDMASDCMFRPEYACYKSATCERQADGECGWTQTAALQSCLSSPPGLDGGTQPQ